jgi:hypothetical protein
MKQPFLSRPFTLAPATIEQRAVVEFGSWLVLVVVLTVVAGLAASVLVLVGTLRVAVGIESLMAGPAVALILELPRLCRERWSGRPRDRRDGFRSL